MMDAIWVTYAIAGGLPEAEKVRAPRSVPSPAVAETGGVSITPWSPSLLEQAWRGLRSAVTALASVSRPIANPELRHGTVRS